jgi:hypothetical protein
MHTKITTAKFMFFLAMIILAKSFTDKVTHIEEEHYRIIKTELK